MREEEHCGKEDRHDPCTGLYLLYLSGKESDERIGYESERDAVRNVVGKWHHCERQK